MRELERHSDNPSARPAHERGVLGRGRLGTVLSAGLRAAGVDASEPLARGAELRRLRRRPAVRARRTDRRGSRADARPERWSATAPGRPASTCWRPMRRFSLHPADDRDRPTTDPSAWPERGGDQPPPARGPVALARELAERLGLRPFALGRRGPRRLPRRRLHRLELPDHAGGGRRAAWPPAPARAGSCSPPWCARRSRTGPRSGPGSALTGPVARGDEATVAAQRAAVAERAPELLDLFDVLVAATRRLAARPDRRAVRACGDEGMRTVNTVAELRASARPGAGAGRNDRPGADHGRPARRPSRR